VSASLLIILVVLAFGGGGGELFIKVCAKTVSDPCNGVILSTLWPFYISIRTFLTPCPNYYPPGVLYTSGNYAFKLLCAANLLFPSASLLLLAAVAW